MWLVPYSNQWSMDLVLTRATKGQAFRPLIAAVLLTCGLAEGFLSVCIGTALLVVAAGFWIAARKLR